MVEKACLSAQRSADRSVQPRSRGRCAAGLPPRPAGLPGDVPAPRRLGNALKRPLRLASPRCPQGAHTEGTGAAALCPCHRFLSPPVPRWGLCRSLPLLQVSGFAAPACSVRQLCRAALGCLPTGEATRTSERGCSASTCPLPVFPSSLQDSQCTAAALLRQGQAPRGGGAAPETGAWADRWCAGHRRRCCPRPARGALRAPAGRPP